MFEFELSWCVLVCVLVGVGVRGSCPRRTEEHGGGGAEGGGEMGVMAECGSDGVSRCESDGG